MSELSVAALLERAQHMVRVGQPNQAKEFCLRVLKAYPKHGRAFGIVGQAYLALGQDDHAADAFFRVLGVYPNDPLANASLAAIYDAAGDTSRALWYLERAFEMAPANPELQQELLRLYHEQGISVEQVQLTRVGLARTYMRGLLYTRAQWELENLEHKTERTDILVSLLECSWNLQDVNRVEAQSQRILALLPDCLIANLLLGNLWLGTFRDEQGRMLLERAQSLDPDNAMAQSLFGARSPLAPRNVRVPALEEELPPLDLSYLDDAAAEAETESEAPQDMIDEWFGWSEPIPEGGSVTAVDLVIQPIREEKEDNEIDPGLSITDIQRMYVNDHPDDWQARLDLARRYRDEKSISLAVEHYSYLVSHNRELLREVVGDLEFLTRRFPQEQSLGGLLREARDELNRFRN